MQLRTKGYLILIGIVIILEIIMMKFYLTAANEFVPYQFNQIFNFTRDNDFESGIGLLFGAIFVQIFLGLYLIYKDKSFIKH